MGVGIMIFSYVVVTLIVGVLIPCFFYLVTNKWLKLEARAISKHFLFWFFSIALLVAIRGSLYWCFGSVTDADGAVDTVGTIESYGDVMFFIGFVVNVILVMKLFNANFIDAVKANVILIIGVSVIFIVVAALFLSFGLSLLS